MAKVLDCNRKVNKFKIQLRHYVHFQNNNTLGKGTEPLYPTSHGLNSFTAVLQGKLWNKICPQAGAHLFV